MRDRKSHTSRPEPDVPESPDMEIRNSEHDPGIGDEPGTPDPEAGDDSHTDTDRGMNMAHEIEELKRSLQEQGDRHLRMLAEYDNFRRRNQGERVRWHREAQEEVVLGMLPVKDDLERMLAQPADKLTLDSVLNGLKLVAGKLDRTLEQFGVTVVQALEQPFDPDLHDALVTSCDPLKPDGVVLMEHQKGYRMGERVIRHAQVVVNRLEDTVEPGSSKEQQ